MIISKYPSFMKDSHAVHFLCDTLKLFVAGVLDAHNLDELMERDLEVLHHEEMETANAMTKLGDSLPAIGIVAAVLGIILTMASVDEGAAIVGSRARSDQHIGNARQEDSGWQEGRGTQRLRYARAGNNGIYTEFEGGRNCLARF